MADREVLVAGAGGDGTGYALALALGHTLVPPVPALTPLEAVEPLCHSEQGFTLEAELALWVDGRVPSGRAARCCSPTSARPVPPLSISRVTGTQPKGVRGA